MNTAITLPTSVAPSERSAIASPQSLHVVILNEKLPNPAVTGSQTQTLDIILRLAQRHRITFLCHAGTDANADRLAQAFLQHHGVGSVLVPRRSGFGSHARLAANWFSPLPLTVASQNAGGMRKAVRRFAAAYPVDLWQCESMACAAALRRLPGIRWLIMAYDIESRLLLRCRDLETNRLKRWHIGRQLRKLLRLERRVCREAVTTVTVHPDDSAIARYAFGARNVDAIGRPADPKDSEAEKARRAWEHGDHEHHLDALAERLEQVWLRCAPVLAAR